MEYTRIFISHHSDDINKAEELMNFIDDQEYLTPILVIRDRQPNELIEKQVEEGIRGSRYVIPILTKNSINSIWVNQEIGFAKGYKVPIYALIENEVLDKLKGFVHKHREHFIFGETESFENKYVELVELIKENEGLGKPNYEKKFWASEGDKACTIPFKCQINENTLFNIRVDLFDEQQEFVIYIEVGNENPKDEYRYIGFSNSNKVNNSADYVRGLEYVYQFDVPGKTKYRKTLNIFNAIKQSGLFFENFPSSIKNVRVRNMNGKIGQENCFYYAITNKTS